MVITFPLRSKRLLISRLKSAVILEPKKIKFATVLTVSPSICHEVIGPDAMILVFWMLSFKPWSIEQNEMYIQELSCFFDDPIDVHNLISGSSAFSQSSLNIWRLMVHVLLKPGLENFEHYFTSMWNECNCAVVWTFFGIAFFGDWNENWPFSVLWPLLSFPNLLAYWVQHFHSIIF